MFVVIEKFILFKNNMVISAAIMRIPVSSKYVSA